jgi:hypothetical protein
MGETPTIKELGGMSEEGILLLIERSERSTETMLDEKLGLVKVEITSSVDARLDKQDEKLDGRLDSQDTKLEEIHSLVLGLDAKANDSAALSNGWHKSDLLYRSSMELRVTRVERILTSIKGFIVTANAFGWMRRSVVFIGKEGKPIMLSITVVTSIWIAVVQFIHTVLPSLRRHHFHH